MTPQPVFSEADFWGTPPTRGNYYNEYDPKAAAWLRELIRRKLIPAGEVDERSIVDVLPSDLEGFAQCHFFAGIGGWPLALQLAGWPSDRPVWTGSCPCQPFSVAGQGKGTSDERHLWPAFKWLIAQRRPPVVFGEQVASKDGRQWLAGVRLDMEEMEYAVGTADLCAAWCQDHLRQRLFWMAHSKHERVEIGWRNADAERQRDGCSGVRESISSGKYLAAAALVGQRGSAQTHRTGEPETTWVHYGVPARVVRVRGYGNAIVPPLAAQFILACEEAIADTDGLS